MGLAGAHSWRGLGVQEELLEEQGIAGGTLDTALGHALFGHVRRPRQGARLLGTQRAEIDGNERRTRGLCTPIGYSSS